MDTKLREIISKAAGTYFIVNDASQVAVIEADPKLRLFFINVEKGPVNMLVKFAKGDTAGFISTYGRGTRLQEKRGNFSISTCLEALTAGPIAVVNLRAFESTDIAGIAGLNPNIEIGYSSNVEYTKLFDTNNFWVPKPKNINDINQETSQLLNFGNVGNSDLSVIVVKALDSDILKLTSEGNKSLAATTLEIDEYPALDFEMLLKDTFVSVYIFNNKFTTPNTNQYYGNLFNNDGNLDLTRISELVNIPESGFVTKVTGSLIPSLINESNETVSIDVLLNQKYVVTGVIASINDDLFEEDNKLLLDMNGFGFFEGTDTKKVDTSAYLLSHVVPTLLTSINVVYPMLLEADNVAPIQANLITYGCEKIDEYSFKGSFEQGLRLGDSIKGLDNKSVIIIGIETLNSAKPIGESTYTEVKYICDGKIKYSEGIPGISTIIKENSFLKIGLVKPTTLISYKPRIAQFTNGTASKQKDILDIINSPGITNGIKSEKNIRYIVDCFKSFVEPNYKYQFGLLVKTLDDSNVFVSCILNEPFIEDLVKSTNPLFKQLPGGSFDWSYLPQGGNKTYSSQLLTKFNTGGYLSYFFGPGNIVGSITRPLAGLVSNLFYNKKVEYDVLANATGYIDGITELEKNISDDDRAFCEAFLYNPIINFNGGNTIYQNLTGHKEKTSLQQIDASELLIFIKQNLYNLSKTEAFKKGNYDDYLRTEIEATNFMTNLVLAQAIKPNPIIICDASNNTAEISKNKIKLIHIEYTHVDSLDKVVFDLKLN